MFYFDVLKALLVDMELSIRDLNYLSINSIRGCKMNFFNFISFRGWYISIGVVLRALKVLEKREKGLEKNKLIFINYTLRRFLNVLNLRCLLIKCFNPLFLNLLRKVGLFRKINILSTSTTVIYNKVVFKKLRRIKRRLKKRLLRYENNNLF